MPSYEEIPKPTTSFVAITKPVSTSYSNNSKPSTSYSEIAGVALFGFLLLENGAFCLNEAGGYYILKDYSPDMIDKPTTSYTNIIKPS